MFRVMPRHRRWLLTASVGLLGGFAADGQELRLQNPDTERAGYGAAVTLSGSFLVIGEDGRNPRGSRSGAVHVMTETATGWRHSQTVRSLGGSVGGRFGMPVALDQNDLVVGESQHSSPLRFSGRVHAFRLAAHRVAGDAQLLQVENAALSQTFGASAAVGGDWLAVGAPGASTLGGNPGAVSLFVRDGAQWRHHAELSPADGSDGDAFGRAVVVQGELMAIGSPHHPGGGQVYVYRLSDGRWREIARLAPRPEARMAEYGTALALAEGHLIVGAPASTTPGYRTGSAEIWRLGESNPERLGLVVPVSGFPDGRFGEAVAFDGRTLAVGAPGEDSMGLATGSVHVFRVTDGRVEGAPVRLAVPSGSDHDLFGAAVSVDRSRLAVGAPATGGGVGAVYVYALDEVMDTDRVGFELVAHPSDGMVGSRVNALAMDARGQLLVGTLEGGLQAFDGRRFIPTSEPAQPASVLAARVDGHGRIWLGTEDGIFRLDRRAGVYLPYELAAGAGRKEPIVAIFEASDGTLWSGTNGRLYAYAAPEDRFLEYEPFTGPPTEFGEEYISGIQQDSSGKIWVLAKNLRQNRASLYAVDTVAATVRRHPLSPDWGQVGPMLVDRRDRLWLKAPAPLALPTTHDLLSPAIAPVEASHWAIVEDRSGAIWLGTEDGVYRAAKDEGLATLHRVAPRAEARREWDFTRSLYEEPAGSMLVGTNAGIYRAFSRTEERVDPMPAQPERLAVTRVEITGRDGSRVQTPYDTRELMLSPRDYRLEFDFALLSYTRPNLVAYRYRLEGFDRDWVDAGDQGNARYTDLPPGDYTFRVRAMPVGRSVAAPLAEHSLQVRIRRPYWQTWWFRGAWILVVVVIAAAAWRYRQSRQLELERLRLRIASDLHDDLSTNLSGIALLAERVAARDALDDAAGRSVGQIHATARDMLEDLRDLVWLVDPSHDSAEGLLMKMRSVAESLLGDRFTLQAEGVPSLHRLRMAERRELLLIYKELLHNAARHARADKVHVGLVATAGGLRLTVADNGVGFDPSTVTPGHGLHSMRQRAQRLGGELRIESVPGSGTEAVFVRTL